MNLKKIILTACLLMPMISTASPIMSRQEMLSTCFEIKADTRACEEGLNLIDPRLCKSLIEAKPELEFVCAAGANSEPGSEQETAIIERLISIIDNLGNKHTVGGEGTSPKEDY